MLPQGTGSTSPFNRDNGLTGNANLFSQRLLRHLICFESKPSDLVLNFFAKLEASALVIKLNAEICHLCQNKDSQEQMKHSVWSRKR